MPVRNFSSRFFIRTQDRRIPTARRLNSLWELTAITCQFRDYFNGFMSHVPGTIVDNFKFSYQLATLSKANATGASINNFLDPELRRRKDFIQWNRNLAGNISFAANKFGFLALASPFPRRRST
jgi:hypothetical protein